MITICLSLSFVLNRLDAQSVCRCLLLSPDDDDDAPSLSPVIVCALDDRGVELREWQFFRPSNAKSRLFISKVNNDLGIVSKTRFHTSSPMVCSASSWTRLARRTVTAAA